MSPSFSSLRLQTGSRRPAGCWLLSASFSVAVCLSVAAPARGDDLEAPSDHARHTSKLFENYCFDCHSNDATEANLNIENLLKNRPLIRNRSQWQRIFQVLELGAMPPDYMPQPTEIEREHLLTELDAEIVRFDYSQIDNPGYEPARRLTHRQFNNTIRDLFGVDVKPADRFPEELTGRSGFDNSANTLFLQPSLMERYIAAAEGVIARVLPEKPTTAEHLRTREVVLIAQPGEATSEDDAAQAVLDRFLLRAYRRPPTTDELASVLRLYDRARGEGLDFEDAIRSVLSAILISPKFLFRIEASGPVTEAYRVSDWELASRLSYFLWASMPDDELFELAERGALSDEGVLAKQVRRMLADPKALELGHSFAAQWFSTRLVGNRIRLDPIDNPWCTDTLMDAMRDETAMFFVSLLRDNRPISELVGANYTYLNEELARTLYRIDGVEGVEMRRVELNDPNRGGILSQPAVLTVTSSHFDTSPIKRGIFVLDQLLGTPPPPPPPDAGEISPKIEEIEDLSYREKLELHSSDASCRACHAQIDPFGFALENFDYFGRWRDYYGRRQTIDNSALLESGARFSGPSGLKNFLLSARHEEMVRQATQKLLAYALGRQLEYYDEPAIRAIEASLEADDYRFQTLLQGIVASYPFQYRKHPTQEGSP